MTTYNTGNALGSSDARDLYDNAENIDNFANGTANIYHDRFGVTRKSLAGMSAAFNDFIESSGYTVPVAYTSGIVLTEYNQLIEYNDEFYKLKAGQAPYTTTGTWGTDSAKLVAVGDAALRQELTSNANDFSLLPEIANYAALRAYTGDVTAYYVRGVANIFDGGAGVFRVDAADTTSADNGGTVLVDASGRRWKREFSGAADVRFFGVIADGVNNDTDAMQLAYSSGHASDRGLLLTGGTYLITAPIVYGENDPLIVRVSGNVNIIGIGYMPRLRSNPEHRVIGDYSRVFVVKKPGDESRHEQVFAADVVATHDNSSGGYKNAVAGYFGADSMGAVLPRIWALNTVTNVHTGHNTGSEAFGYELDINIDNGYTNPQGEIAGLYIAGKGDLSNALRKGAGIWIRRTGDGSAKWKAGINLQECIDGILIEGNTVSRHAMLVYQTDASIRFVPETYSPSKSCIEVAKSGGGLSYQLTGNGDMKANTVKIGPSGNEIKQVRSYKAPSVGSGDIAAGAAVTKELSEIFSGISHNWGNCDINLSVGRTGGLASGLEVSAYYDPVSNRAYVRWTNRGATQISNSGYDIRITVTEF